MKKFLLLAVLAFSAFFLFGCGSDDASTEDQAADLGKALNAYTGACADIAFADTRAKMKEVDQYRANNQVPEATQAYADAKELFDKAVQDFTDLTNSNEKSVNALADQKARLANLQSDGNQYASKEYTAAQKKLDAAFKSAEDNLTKCNTASAEATLAKSEKDLATLEDVVATKMSAAGAQPAQTSKATYTVQKGDSLWKIASSKYSNPYFWPLIYWSNKSSIKDPDMIYPNQKFAIDNSYDSKKKDEAQKFAKTRGAWSLYDNK